MPRKRLPRIAELMVLRSSLRRCCICFGLNKDLTVKQGQIAHLDRNRANHEVDNLAFMCLPHHDWFDTRPSQSKGALPAEAKRFRNELYAVLLSREKVDDFPDRRETFEMQVVRYTRDGGFDGPETMTLEELFKHTAPLMLVEAHEDALISWLERAFLRQRDIRILGHQPRRATLSNEDFQRVKARLWALGLIRPSEKPHTPGDTNSYWTLTSHGQQYLRTLMTGTADGEHADVIDRLGSVAGKS